jgi:hypothetical protein
MLTTRDILARKEYNRDLMRAARADRLVQLATAGERCRFYSGALCWLGHRMIVWGKNLQEQHGAVISASLPQTPDHALSG